VNDPLIYVRAVHFAATITVAGIVFFSMLIAEPVFRKAGDDARLPGVVRTRLAWLAWIALALSVASGAAWLVLVAQGMSGGPLADVFSEGVLSTVVLQTGFGRIWLERFVTACFVALVFPHLFAAVRIKAVWFKAVAVALASAFVGMLAWAGHAVGGLGLEGIVHPAADVLHLVAAAAWLGTLLPLALVLGAAGQNTESFALACATTMRFSAFGIASVGALLITGAINSWYLAGSVPALAETDYGRLLLTKITLFLVMFAIAAINRLWLTPRLRYGSDTAAAQRALRQLRRNTAAEVLIGAIIIVIVAVLGVTPPGLHEGLAHAHHSH